MVFHFFHKHSKKILIIGSIACVFSLFTFSIQDALQAFTGRGSGRAGSTLIRFKTTSGRLVEITQQDWAVLNQEILGYAALDQLRLYADLNQSPHLPLIHAILMAEADEVSVRVPPEVVEERYQEFLLFLQAGAGGQAITRRDLSGLFDRFRLTEDSFKQRLGEALRTQIYRRTVQGTVIHDPKDIQRHFQHKNELVTVQYVEFPFAAERALLEQEPPGDAVLAAFYAELPAGIRMTRFSHPLRLTLEVACIDFDAFDPAAVPADYLSAYQDPSDTQILNRFRGDPKRYGTLDTPVETAADLPADQRERILHDFKVAAVLQAMRTRYDALVQQERSALDAASQVAPGTTPDADPPGTDGDGSGGPRAQDAAPEPAAQPAAEPAAEPAADAAADAARQAAMEEKLRAEFARLAAELGLEVKRIEKMPRDELRNVDPPAHENFPFIATMLQSPGDAQVSEPAREAKYGYIVRLVERVAPQEKTLEEARAEVLEHWYEVKSEERTRERARAFRDAVRSPLIASVPAEAKSTLDADLAAAKARVEAQADLVPEERKRQIEALEAEYFINLGAFLGPREGPAFEVQAAQDVLETKTLGPHRRSTRFQPFFRDRFSGAERFLLEQEGAPFDGTPKLLGFAVDTVSDLLVDSRDTKAIYVARVLKREPPDMAQMSPQDRLDAENANTREIFGQYPRIPYFSPYSIENLTRVHAPEVAKRPRPEEEVEASQ